MSCGGNDLGLWIAAPVEVQAVLEYIVCAVGIALVYIGWNIMLDMTKLNAALASIGASVESVAAAIRNPQVDNNSQAAIDEFAGRLEAVAAGLTGLAAEETALDTAESIAADPPASDPIVETGTGTESGATGTGTGEDTAGG